MGKAESQVEKYLVDAAKKQGWLCFKFTSPGNSGVPDRIVIGNNKTVFVELKRPGGKVRPLQQVQIKQMQKVGADVHIIDNQQDVDKLINSIKNA